MEVIKEILIEDSPETFNVYEIERILKQMKKSICKIEIYDPPQKATGFFCNIRYKGENNTQNKIQSLITCNHVIDSFYVEKLVNFAFLL